MSMNKIYISTSNENLVKNGESTFKKLLFSGIKETLFEEMKMKYKCRKPKGSIEKVFFPDCFSVQSEKFLISEFIENDGEKIALGIKVYTAKVDQSGNIVLKNVGFANQCDTCKKTFDYNANLQTHKLTHQRKRNLSCSD